MKNLAIDRKKWKVNGSRKGCWVGRDSFKLANMLSKHFSGQGGWETKVKRWIEHNQKLLGENVILRVFGETGDWRGHPMFGAEPKDMGIWNHTDLHKIVKENSRIKHLTLLNESVIRWLIKESHETGVAFEYTVDATLKGVEGFNTGITDHAIRQTARFFRKLIDGPSALFPNAKIIIEARNEWRAHDAQGTNYNDVNMWAHRFYRWVRDGRTEVGFEPPGNGWIAEQWPEGHIIVSGTLSKPIHVGLGPGVFKMSLEHPERNREKWWELPETFDQLVDEAHNVPYGYNESIMYVDQEDEPRIRGEVADGSTGERWYGKWAYTHDLEHYIDWLNTCRDNVDYFIIHDEKGMQCDVDWPRPLTKLEEALGGSVVEPPDPPGPPKVSYERVVKQAFVDILNRQPHYEGLRNYDKKMAEGMTEAQLREILIRSLEFAKRNER